MKGISVSLGYFKSLPPKTEGDLSSRKGMAVPLARPDHKIYPA